jgi:cytochrome c-type biogenesis protein CcsB
MNNILILSITTYIYLIAAIFYIGSFSFKKTILANIGFFILVVAFAANTAGIILRWIESYKIGHGYAPLSNMYESMVFFSWTMAIIYIFVEIRYKERIIGAFITPLIFLSIAYASLSPSMNAQITPLVPALKSNWLIIHVITCFLGYSGFAVAFGLSIIRLIRKDKTPGGSMLSRLPSSEIVDELTYQMIIFGFLFLTIGNITGAVWANSAWGKYWSWDPKETWSLINWIIYAIFLHLRIMRGWSGKKLAYVSIIGFLTVLFNYFGVNFFLSGLHSYA